MNTERRQVLTDAAQRERLERTAAARDVLDAEPMETPPVEDLRAELDELRGGE